ncbi:MAG: rhomboid family intramembrane serine protease [Nanoarchaeota archaeon]|nr:rhomboid family intramembrane serine protease [Nanoarchaeota archaeon]
MKAYTLLLAGICILFLILQITIPGFTKNLLLNQNSFAEPWRFVSSIFLHAGLSHLIYNLFALLLFGLILENIIGSRKFLLIFFSAGILANLISVNFYSSSLGASGAIFGIIGALTVLRPMMYIFAFGLPMPLFIASIIWVAGDIIMTFLPTNIGTIAHLTGLFIGLLLGFLFRKKYSNKRKLDLVKIPDEYMNQWENYYMR